MATVGWDPGRKKTISIPSAGTESDILNLESLGARRTLALEIRAPALGAGETITLQVASSATGTFAPQQSGGADITIPDSKVTPVLDLNAGAIKLVSAVAVAAQRDFEIWAGARE